MSAASAAAMYYTSGEVIEDMGTNHLGFVIHSGGLMGYRLLKH